MKGPFLCLPEPWQFWCEDPMATGAFCNCVCYFWACLSLQYHPPTSHPVGPAPASTPGPFPGHPLPSLHGGGSGWQLESWQRKERAIALDSYVRDHLPFCWASSWSICKKSQAENLNPSKLISRGCAVLPQAPSPASPQGQWWDVRHWAGGVSGDQHPPRSPYITLASPLVS